MHVQKWMPTTPRRTSPIAAALLLVATLAAVFTGAKPAAAAYVTEDIATTAEGLNGTNGGQCKVFVNNVVHTVAGVPLGLPAGLC